MWPLWIICSIHLNFFQRIIVFQLWPVYIQYICCFSRSLLFSSNHQLWCFQRFYPICLLLYFFFSSMNLEMYQMWKIRYPWMWMYMRMSYFFCGCRCGYPLKLKCGYWCHIIRSLRIWMRIMQGSHKTPFFFLPDDIMECTCKPVNKSFSPSSPFPTSA